MKAEPGAAVQAFRGYVERLTINMKIRRTE
jgi:hypothetical protein